MRDLVIIGAGPAGMAATITAQTLGLNTLVLDEQADPGGQIYRNVLQSDHDAILGPDYVAGRRLVQDFLASGATYRPGSRVWRVDEDGVFYSGHDGARSVLARHVLLATGAMERPVPSVGWTLPGVMTAGAAQIMLKSGGIVADGAVFVGSGPLMYLIVAQYLRAGIKIKAVLDTTPRGSYVAALSHTVGALRGWRYLRKGVGLLREIRKAGVRIQRIDSYEFTGEDSLEGISCFAGSRTQKIDCHLAFVHQGVIPTTQASMSTGCHHRWDAPQTSWQPDADAVGQTSIEWLRIAGDSAGIVGAVGARYAGERAAVKIAADQARLSADDAEKKIQDLRSKDRADVEVRPFLDRLYQPRAEILAPTDDNVTLCRCELVSRGDVRDAVAEGCPGPNQLKAFTRAGMGPCQGRMCGPLITATMADMSGQSTIATGYYNIRSPFRPVTMNEIAGMEEDNG